MNKGKRTNVVLLALFMVAVATYGALEIINRGSFSGTTTNTGIESYLPAQNGMMVNQSMSVTCETNATIVVYRPNYKTRAQDAVASSSNLYVYTDTGKGTLGGITPVAADSVIVQDTGSTDWDLVGVASITTNGVDTNDYMLIVLDATITCATNSPVYFADAGDFVEIPALAATDQTRLSWMWTGFKGMPVVIEMPTTAGGCVMSGTYSVEK